MLLYFFFPFALIISSSLGILISPIWAFAPFVWVLVIIPLIDLILPKLSKQNNKLNETKFHNLALILVLPGIICLIILGLFKVSANEVSILQAAALGAAVGMSGGSIGITTAHELIHRSNKVMRGFGIIILVLCLYGHFRIEHIYGHHKNFATKIDPATARKGENFYFFFLRCVLMSVVSSWMIEKKILKKKNFSVYSFRNRIIHYFVIELILIIISFLIAGINGLVFIFVHSTVSVMLLELVDYIQHYGLERSLKNEKYETYGEKHSWNSRHSSANWSTFNLGLHSDHHQLSSKHYPLLSQQKKIMEMPSNYSVMIMMALVPPIWFKVMDPKLN